MREPGGLRLLRRTGQGLAVTVDGLLTADGMLPVPLERLTIATNAEAGFLDRQLPKRTSRCGRSRRNRRWFFVRSQWWDGTARIAQITIVGSESLIYVPTPRRSTTCPFAIRERFHRLQVRADRRQRRRSRVEATIRWRSVVHNALPAGTSIAHVAHIRYDGERDDEIRFRRATHPRNADLRECIPGLPFGLDGMLGPALAAHPRALSEDRFLQLPPATPVGDSNGSHPSRDSSARTRRQRRSAQPKFSRRPTRRERSSRLRPIVSAARYVSCARRGFAA